MSKTQKGSRHRSKRVLELRKREDGTFDLLLGRTLDRSGISEQWLSQELCVRFGFCGEEYRSILRDVKKHGMATIVF